MPTTTAPLLRSLCAVLLAVALVGCASPDASSATTAGANTWTAAPAPATTGRMVELAGSPTSFAPESSFAAVNVNTLDMKAVFEEIGPEGALWYQHVQTLSNPFFEGRVNGSDGTERARDYMEYYFRMYDLAPAFPDETTGDAEVATSYRQPFEFSAGRRLEISVTDAVATLDGEALEENEAFTVLGVSGSGTVTGPVTFVGYGIESGENAYTSFDADTDLSGRIALLLRYEPLGPDGRSQWADERFSGQAALARKFGAVMSRNPAGIILVNPPDCADGRTVLEPIDRSARFGAPMGVPVIQMSTETADALVRAADPEGRDLRAWRRLADNGEVRCVPLGDSVQVSFGAELERTRESSVLAAENLGAVLPGRGTLADEWLVIGGHYDHNGFGAFGTEPENGPLFPGADDNASGVAGLLVLAKRLAEDYAAKPADANLRSVLFLAFDAEERGLHGSRHFSEQPTIDPTRTTALLNMDMIGRLRSDELTVLGTATAVGLEDVLRPHFERSGLTVNSSPAGSGRSDDANFDRIGIPAMHFFTGMHPEYTTPQDHGWTVNPVGGAKIVTLMEDIALDLVSRDEKLVHADPGRTPGQNRGYASVRLGIRPGMGVTLETGILVDDVSTGTSAADGGILPGDVLLRWNDVELDGMRTLVEQLRAHKPGDVVKVAVLREREEKVLDVTLKASE